MQHINKSRIVLQEGGSLKDLNLSYLPDERPPDDGFDPRLHRISNNPIKLYMAYLNVIRSAFGAGLLGIPQAASFAGMILGPVITVFVGIIVVHSHFTLIWCLNEISRQLKIPYTSFRYGFRIALCHGPRCMRPIGERGIFITNFFMFLSQLATCCVCVIFTTDSFRDLMDWDTSVKAMKTLFVPFLLMEFFMTSLKVISFVSMLGNILNIIGLVLLIYLFFEAPHSHNLKLWSLDITDYSFAFGMNIFCINAFAVILTLDRALKNPFDLTKRFGIINVGLLVTTCVSSIFGPLGYWAFNSMEDNVLRSLPYDHVVSMISIAVYMIAVGLAFPIQCHPGIEIVLQVYKHYSISGHEISNFHMNVVDTISRLLFVILAFVICYYVPYQGPFVAFAGNLCSSLIVVVFPAIMELSIMYPGPYGKYHFYLFKNLILIVMGLILCITGVVQCGNLLYIRTVAQRKKV